MKLIETKLEGVKIIEPRIYGDDRGFFMEAWNAQSFSEAGLNQYFVQDNHSRSSRGVLRGLHYQLTRPQGKLVRVVTGRAFDVAVDIRRSSATFGEWVGVELSAQNRRMMWVPPGFAHGFLCLEDKTDFLYKCTDYYAPEDERAIHWADVSIAINWPELPPHEIHVSPKDAAAASLAGAEVYA